MSADLKIGGQMCDSLQIGHNADGHIGIQLAAGGVPVGFIVVTIEGAKQARADLDKHIREAAQ